MTDSIPPAPAPGTTWTPTRDVKRTFVRQVVAVDCGILDRQRDGVWFSQKADDGRWDAPVHCFLATWRTWLRDYAVIQKPDPRDAEIERLRSLLTRALDQHEDENGLNEGYREHWAEMARKELGR